MTESTQMSLPGCLDQIIVLSRETQSGNLAVDHREASSTAKLYCRRMQNTGQQAQGMVKNTTESSNKRSKGDKKKVLLAPGTISCI